MALDSGAGIKIGENEWLRSIVPPTPDDVWLKETVLATWGKPKEPRTIDLPKIEMPKVEQVGQPKTGQPKIEQSKDGKPKTSLSPAEMKELEDFWKSMQPEVSVDRDVREVVFSNGDKFKIGGRDGWSLTDKNGNQVKIVEYLNPGQSTLHRYRLSNGATYSSGCFTDSIHYPNGDSITFRGGIWSMKGGKPVKNQNTIIKSML